MGMGVAAYAIAIPEILNLQTESQLSLRFI